MKKTLHLLLFFIALFIVELVPSSTFAASLSVTVNPVAWWDKLDGNDQIVTVVKTAHKPAVLVCLRSIADNSLLTLGTIPASTSANKTVSLTRTDAQISAFPTGNYRVFVTTATTCSGSATATAETPATSPIRIFSSFVVDLPTTTTTWNSLDDSFEGQNVSVTRNDEIGTDTSAHTLQVCIQPTVGTNPTTFLGKIDPEYSSVVITDNAINNQTKFPKGAYKIIVKSLESDLGELESEDCNTNHFYLKKEKTFNIVAKKLNVSVSSPWDQIDTLDQKINIARTDVTTKVTACLKSSDGIYTTLGSISNPTLLLDVPDSKIVSVATGTATVVVTTDTDCSVPQSATVIRAESAPFQLYSSLVISDNQDFPWNKLDESPQIIDVVRENYNGKVLICMKKGTAPATPLGTILSDQTRLTVWDDTTSPNISALSTGNYTMTALATSDQDCSKTGVAKVSQPITIVSKEPKIEVTSPIATTVWNVLNGTSQNVTIKKTEVYGDLGVCIQPESGGVYTKLGIIPRASSILTVTDENFPNNLVSGKYKIFVTTDVGAPDCSKRTDVIWTNSSSFQINVPAILIDYTPRQSGAVLWDKNDGVNQTIKIERKNYVGKLLICLKRAGSTDEFATNLGFLKATTANATQTLTVPDSLLTAIGADGLEIVPWGAYQIVVTGVIGSEVQCSPVPGVVSASSGAITVFKSFDVIEPTDDWNTLDNISQTVSIIRNKSEGNLNVCLQSQTTTKIYYSLGTIAGDASTTPSISDNFLKDLKSPSGVAIPIGKKYKFVVSSGSCSTIIDPQNNVTTKVSTNDFTLLAQDFTVKSTGPAGSPDPLIDWDKSDNKDQLIVIKRGGVKSKLKVCMQTISIDKDENGNDLQTDVYNILGTLPAVTNANVTSTEIITDTILSDKSNGPHKIIVTTAFSTSTDPGVDCSNRSDANIIWSETSINIKESLNIVTPEDWNKKDGYVQEVKILRGDNELPINGKTYNNGYQGNVLVCALRGTAYTKLGVISAGSNALTPFEDTNPLIVGLVKGSYKLVGFEIPTADANCNVKNVIKVSSFSFDVVDTAPSLSINLEPNIVWNKADGIDQTVNITRSYSKQPILICIKPGASATPKPIKTIPYVDGINDDSAIIPDSLFSSGTLSSIPPGQNYSIIATAAASDTSIDCNTAFKNAKAEATINFSAETLSLNISPNKWNKEDNLPQTVSLTKTGFLTPKAVKVCLLSEDGTYLPFGEFSATTNTPLTVTDESSSNLYIPKSLETGMYQLVATTGTDCADDSANFTRFVTEPFEIFSEVPISEVKIPEFSWSKLDGVDQVIKIVRKNKVTGGVFDGSVKICITSPTVSPILLKTISGAENETTITDDQIKSNTTFPLTNDTSGKYKIIATAGSNCANLGSVSSSEFTLTELKPSISISIHPTGLWNVNSLNTTPNIVTVSRVATTSEIYLYSKIASVNGCSKFLEKIPKGSTSVVIPPSKLDTITGKTNFQIVASTNSDITKCLVSSSPNIVNSIVPVIFDIKDLGFSLAGGYDGVADNDISGWGWSERTGWISFSSRNELLDRSIRYGVDINLGKSDPKKKGLLTGYAWSENLGWLSFNPVDVAYCPNDPNPNVAYTNPTLSGAGSSIDPGRICQGVIEGYPGSPDSDLRVFGWAKFLSSNEFVSLDHFTNSPGGVYNQLLYDNNENRFHGWAWDGVGAGWINFNADEVRGFSGVVDKDKSQIVSYPYFVNGPLILPNNPTVKASDDCGGNYLPNAKVSFTPEVPTFSVSYQLLGSKSCVANDYKPIDIVNTQTNNGEITYTTGTLSSNSNYCFVVKTSATGVLGYDSYSDPSISITTKNESICKDGQEDGVVQITDFYAKPSSVKAGNTCNLEFVVDGVGKNSFCKIDKLIISGELPESIPLFDNSSGDNYSGRIIDNVETSSIKRETKYKLTCGQVGDDIEDLTKIATCYINNSFKEVK